ncbi:hypothetical protein HMPREF1139_0393 [Campylobacter sp. FOBRC14]|nr:hypothetical protein HMPREF1139_0393 [Campylobacter sp. FOBRC14]
MRVALWTVKNLTKSTTDANLGFAMSKAYLNATKQAKF